VKNVFSEFLMNNPPNPLHREQSATAGDCRVD